MKREEEDVKWRWRCCLLTKKNFSSGGDLGKVRSTIIEGLFPSHWKRVLRSHDHRLHAVDTISSLKSGQALSFDTFKNCEAAGE